MCLTQYDKEYYEIDGKIKEMQLFYKRASQTKLYCFLTIAIIFISTFVTKDSSIISLVLLILLITLIILNIIYYKKFIMLRYGLFLTYILLADFRYEPHNYKDLTREEKTELAEMIREKLRLHLSKFY